MSDNNEKEIVIETPDGDFVFLVDREKYNRYINSLTNNRDKVVVFHNFCVDTVTDECKKPLLTFIAENPGSEMELGQILTEEYPNDLGLRVKKRKNTPKSATATATTG